MEEQRSLLTARLIAVGMLTVVGWAIIAVVGHAAFRLLATTWVTIMGLLVVFILMGEPKSDRPITWAQGMGGATGAFALFLLAYGSVPHEWLTYAGSVLRWRDDKYFLKPAFYKVLGVFRVEQPLTVSGRAVQDTIATVIYVIFFGLNIALFIMWQKRRKAAAVRPARPPAPTTTAAGTSAFGRPVVRQN